MPHDEMLAQAEIEGTTQTDSWITKGIYSRPQLSATATEKSVPYRFATISEVANRATTEEDGNCDDSIN